MSASSGAISSIVVNGVTLEATERGQGRPILFLHPGIGIDAGAPVLDMLAKGGRVIEIVEGERGFTTRVIVPAAS